LRLLTRVGLLLTLIPLSSLGQDLEWARMWEEAQRLRPKKLSSMSRIAPAAEPGVALVIRRRVYGNDGRTPAAGVTVFAYQTDAAGVYNRPNVSGCRLRGWAQTDSSGRFEFRTIRPASYPDTRILAHVHFTIDGPSLPRRFVSDLNFADDPLVTQAERLRAAKEGAFGSVRPVTLRDGAQHVDFQLRISDRGKF